MPKQTYRDLIERALLKRLKDALDDYVQFAARRADAAASGGVRSKPLLAGERSDARGKGETGGQAPALAGRSEASPANNVITVNPKGDS